MPNLPTPQGDLGAKVAFLQLLKYPIPREECPGPAGSEWGPRSPTFKQRRCGAAVPAAPDPDEAKRGEGPPDPGPHPRPRETEAMRLFRGTWGVGETMKLGDAQTRR